MAHHRCPSEWEKIDTSVLFSLLPAWVPPTTISIWTITFKRRSWDIYIQSNISWTSPWYFIFHLDFTKVVNPTSVGMSALQQRCKLTHRHLYRKTWCYGNLSFIFVTCCLSIPEYSLANFEVLFSKPPVRIITESEIYPQNTIRPVAVWDWKK